MHNWEFAIKRGRTALDVDVPANQRSATVTLSFTVDLPPGTTVPQEFVPDRKQLTVSELREKLRAEPAVARVFQFDERAESLRNDLARMQSELAHAEARRQEILQSPDDGVSELPGLIGEANSLRSAIEDTQAAIELVVAARKEAAHQAYGIVVRGIQQAVHPLREAVRANESQAGDELARVAAPFLDALVRAHIEGRDYYATTVNPQLAHDILGLQFKDILGAAYKPGVANVRP